MKFEEPVYRPPMEAQSLLLPVMQSCTWNKCNFCYRDKNYSIRIATPEDVEQELISQLPFYGPRPDIFLVGSDVFAISSKRLLAYLGIIRKHLPEHGQISMFSRVDAIRNKSDADLYSLAKAGITRLYVGTENGNDEALALMNKGHTVEEAREQLKRLDKAGIKYAVFYIFGLGGKGKGIQCGIDTARFFNSVHPEKIVTTGMTVTEGTGAAAMEKKGKFVQASEREKIEEMAAFFQNLEVGAFYDGIHMLNPLHFRFDTGNSAAKKQVLEKIQEILDTCNDAELEKAIDRQAMAKASAPKRA